MYSALFQTGDSIVNVEHYIVSLGLDNNHLFKLSNIVIPHISNSELNIRFPNTVYSSNPFKRKPTNEM